MPEEKDSYPTRTTKRGLERIKFAAGILGLTMAETDDLFGAVFYDKYGDALISKVVDLKPSAREILEHEARTGINLSEGRY